MERTSELGDDAVVVRPRASLVRTSVTAAVAAVVPVLVALLWLSGPVGQVPAVLSVTGLVLVACLLAWLRFRAVHVAVTPSQLVKQPFDGGRVRVERVDVHEVVLATTFREHSTETVRQLMALAADGTCLLRLRGTFWTDEALEAVAHALDVPLIRSERPVPLAQFYRRWPSGRRWYEGRRWVTALVALAGAGVVGLLLAVLFDAFRPA
ncbi:hypothetical protein [Frigoribacterium salinisoli]